MTDHMVRAREEWLAAPLELLQAEKELTRRSDELAQRRQELPWVRIDKEYRFHTDDGIASLADLFEGRSQLLVHHFNGLRAQHRRPLGHVRVLDRAPLGRNETGVWYRRHHEY